MNNKVSEKQIDYYDLPKGKPSLLIKALLHMTMETEEATERNNAPITPIWNFPISPIFCSKFFFLQDSSQ